MTGANEIRQICSGIPSSVYASTQHTKKSKKAALPLTSADDNDYPSKVAAKGSIQLVPLCQLLQNLTISTSPAAESTLGALSSRPSSFEELASHDWTSTKAALIADDEYSECELPPAARLHDGGRLVDIYEAMDNFRKKPSITDDIQKQRILHVYDRRSLDQAVKILLRYFVVGLDAKVRRGPTGKYVSYIVLATSNELILLDVLAVQRMPYFKWFEWTPLARLLNDPNIIKVGYGMSTKQQLIKDILGGTFLGGVIDMKEAFRAIEITDPNLTAAASSPCEGLRALEKICYNLLDKQIPSEVMCSCDPPEGVQLSHTLRVSVVTEAFIVFHAYVELERRVRPRHLQTLIHELLAEPTYDDYLKLALPWSSVWLVETLEQYLDAVEYLKKCSVLGFDSEWKPTRAPGGGGGRMALLQVASDEKVFLFDIIRLQRILNYGDWSLLKIVFTDPKIIKLGFDTRDDSKLLKDFMGPVEMESVKDLALVMRALEKLRPDHMRPKAEGHVFPVVRGLSRLCNLLLGKPLNKSKKLSMTNWERRPLARVFLEYAALDAHCLVLCWRELLLRLGEEKAEEMIDISVIAYNVETEALRNGSGQIM